jgi:hypothetical protein
MGLTTFDLRRGHQPGRCPLCGAHHMDHWPWCDEFQRIYPSSTHHTAAQPEVRYQSGTDGTGERPSRTSTDED